MGAKTIAFINLKGGVAKTTTTVGLATVLAGTFKKKVLVIDLDPQTNCTTMLIGETRWKELNKAGHTLHSLFHDAVNNGNTFDLAATLQKNVSDIKSVRGLDLIPSSLDMIDLQDSIRIYHSPIEILRKAVKDLKNEYDYVLIDCPPNLGMITQNGLRIANGYIIPTIPDVLSTYGIPQITTRVRQFSEDIETEIRCYGIVATKVRTMSSMHERTLRELRKEKEGPLFETIFYENNQMSEAAEFQEDRPVGTLRQKWGYQGQYDSLEQFAQEVMAKLEG